MPKIFANETPEERKARVTQRNLLAQEARDRKRAPIRIAEMADLLPPGTYSDETMKDIAAVARKHAEYLMTVNREERDAREAKLFAKAEAARLRLNRAAERQEKREMKLKADAQKALDKLKGLQESGEPDPTA